MAHKLPSNPEFLLEYMRDLPDEGESDDDFDGYLDTDEGPVTDCESQRDEEQHGVMFIITSTVIYSILHTCSAASLRTGKVSSAS